MCVRKLRNVMIASYYTLLLYSAQCYYTPYPYTVKCSHETKFLSTYRHEKLKLYSLPSNDDMRNKASVLGVSISPLGFLALLVTNTSEGHQIILPVRVTSSQDDAFAASSPESLTICQLVSGVDMAGPLLKPSILNEVVALSCSIEDSSIAHEPDSSTRSWVNQMIAKSLDTPFATAPSWERYKVIFPSIQLVGVKIQLVSDDLKLDDSFTGPFPLKYILDCRIDENQSLSIPLYSEVGLIPSNKKDLERELIKNELILRQSIYSFDESSSAAYLALSLALRYKAPIYISSKIISTLEATGTVGRQNADEVISKMFPKWRPASSARTMSMRTVNQLEQEYAVKKLMRARQVAESKGDNLAATKIDLEIRRLKDFVDSRKMDILGDADLDEGILG